MQAMTTDKPELTPEMHEWYVPYKHQERCTKCGLWRTRQNENGLCRPYVPLVLR